MQASEGSDGRRSPEAFFEGIQRKELSRFFNGIPSRAFFRMTFHDSFSKLLNLKTNNKGEK
jgi:hypothetical protein